MKIIVTSKNNQSYLKKSNISTYIIKNKIILFAIPSSHFQTKNKSKSE
jgi:hypothetical protein